MAHYYPTMARKTSVLISDDLDGSEGAETVTFGLDGVTYEIDLSPKNRAKLDKAFAPYLDRGRRLSVRRRRPAVATSVGPRVDRAVVRAWAKGQGLHVSERGRISADVMQKYDASH